MTGMLSNVNNFSISHLESSDSWNGQLVMRKQQDLQKTNSCDELETIQEEDDEFQYSSSVEKLSKSGIWYNKRVLSLDQESLCYYSKIPVYQNQRINSFKYKPKARIFLKNITSIIIPTDKPTCLKISGVGTVIHKEKLIKKNEKFDFVFRFNNTQLPEQWRNLIFATKEAIKSKSYLVTFEDLMKFTRSDTS